MGKYDFEEELSDSDDDDILQDEIESLSMACMPSTTSDGRVDPSTSNVGTNHRVFHEDDDKLDDDDDDDDDDLELLRSIKEQYGYGFDIKQPLSLKPLTSLPPVASDDDEDDLETLRAIQKRFSHYGDGDIGVDGATAERKNGDNVDKSLGNDGIGTSLGSDYSDIHREDVVQGSCEAGDNVETSSCSSSFPMAAQTFIEAIKKNRSCQKFIRNKMLHIEARMEEIKELQKRLKTLRDFQVQCKKKIGRASSQKQDARIQLISAAKQRAVAKGTEKNISAMSFGPLENSHVAWYKTALKNFPLSFQREKWSKNEMKALEKGITIQLQERLFDKSSEVLSALEESDFVNGVDGMISSITNLDITPEIIQDFSEKVDWNKLASRFPRRSGAECEARWFNHENRLTNRGNWTSDEDKRLLLLIQNYGIHSWSYIAEKMESNRTPFQCLTRYQRSLNASILKRDWSEDEDSQLRSAVESFGESNWQAVASVLEGRTGTQCSNRWRKTLLPARQRVGRWSIDEDKRLRVAVTLFGHKSWHRIAQFVPGRTQAQCRERWANVLDPSLNLGEWTVEDDTKLKEAIAEYGYCWSKVAVCVPLRTDNQCRRRWKKLFPNEVLLLKAARDIKKTALISNFVDRESERPALEANDFVSLPITDSTYEQAHENVFQADKRNNLEADPTKELVSRCGPKKTGSRKRKARNRSIDDDTDCDVEWSSGDSFENNKRKTSKSCSKKKRNSRKLSVTTKSKKSCAESQEHRETKICGRDIAIRLRPRRPRGARVKEIPPTSYCGGATDTSGTHDTCMIATSHLFSSDQNNGPGMLHSQCPCDSQLRLHDEEQVSNIVTMARRKRSSKLQPRRGAVETTIVGSNCGEMHETRSMDAAGPSKQNFVKRLKKNKFYIDQSTKWEDLPLSVVFNNAVTRLQKRVSR